MYIQDKHRNKIVPLQTGADLNACPEIILSSKPLQKISEDHPEINLTNTVLVDDLPCNFGLDNPKNGILIPPFKPNTDDLLFENDKRFRVIGNDLCLFRLIHYLSDDGFSDVKDVRDYDLTFFRERSVPSFRCEISPSFRTAFGQFILPPPSPPLPAAS
jgi:hypothetical protein